MVDNIKYATAMTEVLYYLKGIRQEDINKIPENLIEFFETNCLKEHKCEFDYTRPLSELKLQEETKGLIAMICYNYWCETEEQKQSFVSKLNKNEIMYEEELKKKYDIKKVFEAKKSVNNEVEEKQIYMVEYRENIFKKMWEKIKKMFRKND